jgi:Flp pilus assembly protein TadD
MKLSRSMELDARRINVALAFSALAFSVSAGAEEQEKRYTMTAITDASFGHTVTTGDYEQAIQRITAPNYHLKESFAAKTNLCVAYTKTGAIGAASDACEAAVTELDVNRFRYSDERANLAVALTNRGVLRAVQGDTDRARQDFVEAVELDSGLATPATNLARLDAGYIAGAD